MTDEEMDLFLLEELAEDLKEIGELGHEKEK